MPLVTVEEHRGLLEADVADQAAQEAVALAVLAQLVDHLAVDEPEVPGVLGDVDRGHLAEEPVEAVGGELLERRVLARAALRIDDVEALFPLLEQLQRDPRRVLHVAVHDDRGVRVDQVEPGGDGHLVPEVARQLDHGDPGVAVAQLGELLERAVAAAVVDVEEAEVVLAGQRRGHLVDGGVQQVDVLFLVVDREDERHPAPLRARICGQCCSPV